MFSKAVIKLSKLNQLSGSTMTLVCWYSVSVLNAVITQETTGSTATNEKNIKERYFRKMRKYCLNF